LTCKTLKFARAQPAQSYFIVGKFEADVTAQAPKSKLRGTRGKGLERLIAKSRPDKTFRSPGFNP